MVPSQGRVLPCALPWRCQAFHKETGLMGEVVQSWGCGLPSGQEAKSRVKLQGRLGKPHRKVMASPKAVTHTTEWKRKEVPMSELGTEWVGSAQKIQGAHMVGDTLLDPFYQRLFSFS